MNDVLFSHKSDDWSTPKFLYWWYVDRCMYFDPCPLHCDHDALQDDWTEHKNIFINPPFSNIGAFVDKAIKTYSALRGKCSITFLLPVRTDTKWFSRLMDFGCDLEFVDHRLKFGGVSSNAPFPVMLVHLNWFCSSFEERHRAHADMTSLHFEEEAFNEFMHVDLLKGIDDEEA